MEARPDPFIRYEQPALLDASRAAIAAHLNVPTSTCVFVPNATMGVNTVLRALAWGDAKTRKTDEILFFSTVYGACGKSIAYIVDSVPPYDDIASDSSPAPTLRVASRRIELSYPLSDDAILAAFHAGVSASRAAGRSPRLCVLDVVSSLPGVRFPFERVVAACRDEGVLSLVDGAQGVGMVALDLAKADPDFLVSNCHKWLNVPRGCAVLYVPLRNQHRVASTLPTSHGYEPRPDLADWNGGAQRNPLPPSKGKSAFETNFEFTGTIDATAYLCVAEALKWREEVLGGEERIREYLWKLNKEGIARVAELLGTTTTADGKPGVLDNERGTMTDCAMANVALPIRMVREETEEVGQGDEDAAQGEDVVIPRSQAYDATQWMLETLMAEHHTFVALFVYADRWWARLSAQVYLDMDDYEWAGTTLKQLCDRVGRREYEAYVAAA